MATQDVNLLEEIDFHIKDIGFAVNSIALSKVLPQATNNACINIETKELEKFTIRLNLQGFQVIGHDFDTDDNGSVKYPVAYETIYSLLQNISASYVDSFGGALMKKLEDLDNDNRN